MATPRSAIPGAKPRFVERLDVRSDALVTLAPHGGHIERHTAEQAVLVAKRLRATCWRCEGYGPNCYRRFHVTSTKIDGARFPKLARIEGTRFAHAISFHGFRGSGEEILVGGRAPARIKGGVRDAIAAAVPSIAVRVATPRDRWPGLDPRNLVNRLSGNGVQLEQSFAARNRHAVAIAEAVAAFYAGIV